ncbi:MAG: lipase family alpha/beta hydrolase [Acidimicrobiia bacterium]
MSKRCCASFVLLVGLLGVGPSAGAASPTGPDPVVVVVGTLSPWWAGEPLAARLRADGRQAWVFELPDLGLGDIRTSGRALDDFVRSVLDRTGAARVDLVGHSQGGLVAREMVRRGGTELVDSVVALGTPHHGTYVADLVALLGLGDCFGVVACQQMTRGSSYLAELNRDDDTWGPVEYTNIYTALDELVRPVASATQSGGATDVLVQAQCPLRWVSHAGLLVDGTVYSGIDRALDHRRVELDCWAL